MDGNVVIDLDNIDRRNRNLPQRIIIMLMIIDILYMYATVIYVQIVI